MTWASGSRPCRSSSATKVLVPRSARPILIAARPRNRLQPLAQRARPTVGPGTAHHQAAKLRSRDIRRRAALPIRSPNLQVEPRYGWSEPTSLPPPIVKPAPPCWTGPSAPSPPSTSYSSKRHAGAQVDPARWPRSCTTATCAACTLTCFFWASPAAATARTDGAPPRGRAARAAPV